MRSAILVLAALLPAIALGEQPRRAPLEAKADAWVLERLAAEGEAEFFVVLREQADLSGASALPTKEERRRFVVEGLRASAEISQSKILGLLAARGVQHRAFWVANMIFVRGDRTLASQLAAREDVARIAANPRVRMETPVDFEARRPERSSRALSIEPNLTQIHAPDLWALGFTGQGVVVAGADTGYSWTHPALQGKYRGWNGSTASHDYNWHDAVHAGGGACGADAPAPCDDFGHGTHTMGTMVGDDGAGDQIGVAPGAKWIGCRNMNQGTGTPASYTECFQFFLAPTDLANMNPDPSKAPDAINDSWSCPPAEGCTDPNVLKTVVENVRAAGILIVSSAGNSGPACSTVSDPIALYQAAFTVGAVNGSDAIASFSSRGPVTADGSNRLKPDVTAPGVLVRSSLPGSSYGQLSGTSMAAPHAVGTAALLLSAIPSLDGDVSALEDLIRRTAVPRTDSQMCGAVAGSQVPNNTYGWGRLDALAAYDGFFTDLSVSAGAVPAMGAPGQPLDYTITVHDASGRSAASAVTLSGTLPSGVAAGAITPSSGSCIVTYPAFSCSLGALIAGADATVTVQVTPSAPGPLSLAAAVSSPETDADSSNDATLLVTQVEFSDVPPSAPMHDFIAKLSRDGVTAGCGTGNFCPSADVTRAQMAVFLLRSKNGVGYTPPAATGTVFADVPANGFAAAWIEALATAGITGGCGSGNYCPGDPVTRAQMAVFLLRTLHGSGFTPPPATGTVFADVPASSFAAAWIERLAAEGLTAGCGTGNYCPGASVSRAQMAVFLVSTFGLL